MSARCKKSLPGARVLNGLVHKSFCDIEIDLEPMSFDSISRCEQVGYFPSRDVPFAKNEKFYNVGIKLFCSTAIFRRFLQSDRVTSLASPQVYKA